MQNAGIEQITSSPEAYARYLDMQGDNPTYSVGNIALVMVALPRPGCLAPVTAGEP